jgi:hypothetical protein
MQEVTHLQSMQMQCKALVLLIVLLLDAVFVRGGVIVVMVVDDCHGLATGRKAWLNDGNLSKTEKTTNVALVVVVVVLLVARGDLSLLLFG